MAANRGFNVPSGTAKLLKYTRKSWTLNNPISGSGGVNLMIALLAEEMAVVEEDII